LPRSAGRAAPNPSALSWKSLGRRTDQVVPRHISLA
jgi:hypothetical protein